jgi:hypothetical protein
VHHKRYKPPYPKIHEFKEKSKQNNNNTIKLSDFNVRLAKTGVGFAVIRKSDDTIL